MHDTEQKVKAKPMNEWSLDEIFDEHERLRRRYEDETNQNPDIGDILWMIEIGCELEDRGIMLNKYYELVEK